ncbi:hypothetical protein [Rhodococcus pyridinivorans]|jgi:hypothetical protein|uniref:hypothetical protein n=2 Tax=Rhodococcus TaxID=1827 RepID=UPI000A44F1BC|nr:hypothetical protein [Rhodococcus pyridinivorans]
MPVEGRYAMDRTRVMNHRNKMWRLGKDFSLVAIGGVDAQLAGVAGAVTALSMVVLYPLGGILDKRAVVLPVGGLLVFAVSYFVAQLRFGSDESPLQWMRLQWAQRFKNPDLLAGGGANKNPGDLHWVAIVWRPEWAKIDLLRTVKAPIYDPQPTRRESFVPKKKPPRITYDQLLDA